MATSRREFLISTAAVSVLAACDPAFSVAEQPTGPVQTTAAAPRLTRGVGVYPGDPAEYFGPTLVPAPDTVRNLALGKPAYHSSSYDYNLTAQLVTDGIATTDMPSWIAARAGERTLPKEEREVLLDHHPANVIDLVGSSVSAELHFEGGSGALEVDRVDLFVVLSQRVDAAALQFHLSTSADGHTWQRVASSGSGAALDAEPYPPDLMRDNHAYRPSFRLPAALESRHFRVEMELPGAAAQEMRWQLGQIYFLLRDKPLLLGGPYRFTSAWKSAGLDEEWVSVDLLAPCTFRTVRLHWIAPAAKGVLQVSDDAVHWRDLQAIGGTGAVEEVQLASPARGRYVRALLLQPATEHGYVLSEMEVMGTGGLVPKPHALQAGREDGALVLSGGRWRLQRDSLVQATGAQLATVGFGDDAWLPATVPGTVLTSYLNAGALPDPNFGQNQLYVSDSFFYADFWYRTEFATPPQTAERSVLVLDGINWKAEVFLNGESLGRLEGAFMRGRFDVTGKLRPGGQNALAVRVEKNANPGPVHQKTYETPSKNGGALGHDAPTFHASVGWDWIPTVRGRNTGIWAEVRLEQTAAVTVADPLVTTVLQGNAAAVTVTAVVRNSGSHAAEGVVRGSLGEVRFSQRVRISANAEQVVEFSPANTPGLRMENPKLWQPNGYGEPTLHAAELRFEPTHGKPGAPLRFQAGLRQWTFTMDGGALRLFINGRRFIARGGNWGFSESMLRYRAREYDAALRYHREMNFNMVRNWVGQIGEDAFYEACDRHGIVVWQDFWLANPWDGPIPDDNALFLGNGRDLVRRIRRHASLGIYCGRNEWYPPQALETGIRSLLAELHADLPYIPSSADGGVSGHGPYHTLAATEYFRTSDNKLHSEIGAPNIPTLDSVRAMMPASAVWPRALDWGLHDFTLQGAQGATSLIALIDDVYGGASNGADWIELAQFLNYDTYRAMFEAQSRDRMGVLLWMSHPCWPSFVWQTYDYYLEPTAAYFGCKKACEALHIQWNPLTEKVEVVNYNAGSVPGLTATAELLNPDGRSVWKQQAALDSVEDSVAAVFAMQYPDGLDAVHFLRLTLHDDRREWSSNTYLRAREEGNLHAIRKFAKAEVAVDTRREEHGTTWKLTTKLTNRSALPSLLTRVKAVGSVDGQRILPAIYDDNFLTLMPGEQRTIVTELRREDCRNAAPAIAVDGFNLSAS